MKFQFGSGDEIGWSFGSSVTWIFVIILFSIPAVIFWKARTKMFFLLFGAALFWLLTPIFFQALSFIYYALIILGFVLITLAHWKGHISKKWTFGLYGVCAAVGGLTIYLFQMGSGVEHAQDNVSGGGGITGVFIFLMISALAVGYLLYQKYDIFDLLGRFEEEEESIESDISSTVEKAITDISEGKDIRETIMRCYEQMGLILEHEGVADEEYMTPREFEEAANKTLDVETSKISRIREIFELARYSSHELREKDKNEVIEDLEALRDELQ